MLVIEGSPPKYPLLVTLLREQGIATRTSTEADEAPPEVEVAVLNFTGDAAIRRSVIHGLWGAAPTLRFIELLNAEDVETLPDDRVRSLADPFTIQQLVSLIESMHST